MPRPIRRVRRVRLSQPRGNYPRSAEQILADGLRYKPAVLRALKAYRRSKPWQGSLPDREAKLGALHAALCEAYGMRTSLVMSVHEPERDGNGAYYPSRDCIVLTGRLSVVTYLHEFAHAAFGSCERKACRWSVNLFRRIFPRSFARLQFEGHTLRRA